MREMWTDWLGLARRAGPCLAALVVLSACLDPAAQNGALAGPAKGNVGTEGVMAGQGDPSPVIRDLQSRKSVLPPGGPFATIAEGVLAASKGAAAAELRVAQLKAEAQSKNWLPQIGPSVSLTTLSGLVASLTLTQPLLDNGRRKAEREFAAADVEFAAVGLSQAMNQRVAEGLSYYIQAQRAQAQAAVTRRAAERLARFEDLMRARVEGGLSDLSQQTVISQRHAEVRAQLAADAADASTAAAQLAALMGRPSPQIGGMDDLHGLDSAGPQALSVLRKRSEGARLLAQAKIARAGMMPGLAATTDVTKEETTPALRLTGLGLLNPGARQTLQALDETATVVERQTAEAGESAERRLITLSGEIAALTARAAQGAQVLAQTESNLELFTQQYEMGRRTLLELVGQYDAFAAAERDQAALRYEIALRRVEMARDLGLLVDGERL